jgi:hypothetical protein
VRLSDDYSGAQIRGNSRVMSYMNAAEFTLAGSCRRVSPVASVRARPAICGYTADLSSARSRSRETASVELTSRLVESHVPDMGLSHFFIRLSRPAAEAVPCVEQDGDGSSGVARRDGLSGVVPVLDGEAQPGEREEDAEDSGDRSVMSR